MAEILKIENLSEHVFQVRIAAPRIAKKRKAGQFVIVRIKENGERIPLTIANGSVEEGWIELIVQAVGESTHALRSMKVGDSISDLAGPLGTPTHIEKAGKVLCIGGGVGIAPLRPITEAFYNAGNEVTTILGARSKDLVILEDDMRSISHHLHVATDDGTYGAKGFVTDVFKTLLAEGNSYDLAVVTGPPMMMKFTSALTLDAGIPTVVSLNPIMIDGTGMCGGCRVTIDGATRFACVDGPEFDAALVDWDELLNRLGGYSAIVEKNHNCRIGR